MRFMIQPEAQSAVIPKSPSLAIRETASDEELLIAVGNKQDRLAFNTLFKRFANRIFAMGMKLTRNEQLANDLVQEAMLMVWQKAPLYDLDRGTAQGWIFTLTRNRCFDLLRKIKRQPVCVNADDIWPQDGDPGDRMESGETGLMAVELDQVRSRDDAIGQIVDVDGADGVDFLRSDRRAEGVDRQVRDIATEVFVQHDFVLQRGLFQMCFGTKPSEGNARVWKMRAGVNGLSWISWIACDLPET